jgi:hypothetical protein
VKGKEDSSQAELQGVGLEAEKYTRKKKSKPSLSKKHEKEGRLIRSGTLCCDNDKN